jgi:hypothetical protein
MIKHKWIGLLSALLMAAAVLFIGIGYFIPSAFGEVTGSAEPPYVSEMDKTKVLDIQIIADEKEWANMLQNATAEEYIPATVIIDGTRITNVGIRPKGNSSLSMVARDSTTDRYSFKIEFDHYVSGQTWLGLDKIVINNMQGDSTYMKEYLSYDLMDYVGVEAPLYTFSNISINNEAWGFYLAVEVLEDSYATRVYGNDHGKLYKPESMGMRGNGQMNDFLEGMQDGSPDEKSSQQVNSKERQHPARGHGQFPTEGAPPNTNTMPGGNRGGFGGQSGGTTLQYTDDEISSYSAIFENSVFKSTDQDYTRMINALKKLNAGEDLDSVVDVEATLKYFAANTVIVNLDSYVSNMSHNYYLYEKGGQLTLLPWDFNLAFGGFQSGNASSAVNFPIDTPVSGVSLEDRPILAKLLEVPEYLELYHSYLRQIVDGYFNSGLFSQTVDSLDALISPYVEADPTAFYDFTSYQGGVSELKKLGILRARSIEGQLDGSIPATTTGQSAYPDALVDASSINLSALGSMGGGRGGFGGIPGGDTKENGENNMNPNGIMQGLDRANMEKAMEIIAVAGEGELTPEQLAQLQELGFTEDQITMFRSRNQGGSFAGGERPGNMQDGANNRPQRGNQDTGGSPSSATAGFDMEMWIVLGTSTALLLGGLLFVIFYKRRRTV